MFMVNISLKYVLKKIEFYFLVLFLFGKYLVTLQQLKYTHFKIYDDVKLVLNQLSLIFVLYVLIIIRWRKFEIIFSLIYIFFALLYQSYESIYWQNITTLIVGLYLSQRYVNDKSFVNHSFFFSGVIYLVLLVYVIYSSLGFYIFVNESIWGRNYISSVLTVFLLITFSMQLFFYKWVSLLSLLLLLLLKSRTSLVSVLIFFVLIYKRKMMFYVYAFVGIVLFDYFFWYF